MRHQDSFEIYRVLNAPDTRGGTHVPLLLAFFTAPPSGGPARPGTPLLLRGALPLPLPLPLPWPLSWPLPLRHEPGASLSHIRPRPLG